jgi:peroxiredoxin Q/BCP
MLKKGERAPEFTLPDETGNDRSLTDFLNVGTTVLYFYPSAFALGSARQACALRDMQADLHGAGLRVVGIGPQSAKSHAKFRTRFSLPFPLLADVDKEVIKMYGVNGPLGIGVRRSTFLIDGSRKIIHAVRADFMLGRHLDLVRKAIMLRAATT